MYVSCTFFMYASSLSRIWVMRKYAGASKRNSGTASTMIAVHVFTFYRLIYLGTPRETRGLPLSSSFVRFYTSQFTYLGSPKVNSGTARIILHVCMPLLFSLCRLARIIFPKFIQSCVDTNGHSSTLLLSANWLHGKQEHKPAVV